MKYLMLLLGDGELTPWPPMSDAEKTALMAKFGEFDRACEARDGVRILTGEALEGPPSTATVRTRGGTMSVTEGPFAEALEGLGGHLPARAGAVDAAATRIRPC